VQFLPWYFLSSRSVNTKCKWEYQSETVASDVTELLVYAFMNGFGVWILIDEAVGNTEYFPYWKFCIFECSYGSHMEWSLFFVVPVTSKSTKDAFSGYSGCIGIWIFVLCFWQQGFLLGLFLLSCVACMWPLQSLVWGVRSVAFMVIL